MRPAVEADIPAIIDMVISLAGRVSGPQRVCRITTGETLARLINGPDGAVFVSQGGFIAGEIGRTVISPDPVAFELGWFAKDGSGADLLDAFEGWAASKGAALVKMSCAGGKVQRMLEARGYRAAEVAMVK